MVNRISARIVVVAIGLMLTGCVASFEVNPSAEKVAAENAATAAAAKPRWLRTELYFATGLLDDPTHRGLSEADWRDFLDRVVTPRFPDGLTVLDGYGQWQVKGGETPHRLASKVIVILHPDTPAAHAALDEVREIYKTERQQKSVLRVTQPAEVSF